MRNWEPIKAICQAATDGPLRVKHGADYSSVTGNSEWLPVALVRRECDAEFISTARTALPDAIAEIEQLRKALEEIKGFLADNALADKVEQLAQDKAELVEAMKPLARIFEGWVKRADLPIHGTDDSILQNAKKLVTKHGGEPK